jgi:hypothetical protein
MIRNALIAAAAVIAVAVSPTSASAQTPGAEVRTWGGDVYQLTDSSLEVLYTILVPTADRPAETAPTSPAQTPMLFGPPGTIGDFLERQPEPLQGRRQSESITLRRGSTEIQLPLASVGALYFARQPVRSTLPPYVAPAHYRYSATAVLTDGSRVESDYVNLGTTFIRGRTAHGRVDIPWEQIEVVRFSR